MSGSKKRAFCQTEGANSYDDDDDSTNSPKKGLNQELFYMGDNSTGDESEVVDDSEFDVKQAMSGKRLKQNHDEKFIRKAYSNRLNYGPPFDYSVGKKIVKELSKRSHYEGKEGVAKIYNTITENTTCKDTVKYHNEGKLSVSTSVIRTGSSTVMSPVHE